MIKLRIICLLKNLVTHSIVIRIKFSHGGIVSNFWFVVCSSGAGRANMADVFTEPPEPPHGEILALRRLQSNLPEPPAWPKCHSPKKPFVAYILLTIVLPFVTTAISLNFIRVPIIQHNLNLVNCNKMHHSLRYVRCALSYISSNFAYGNETIFAVSNPLVKYAILTANANESLINIDTQTNISNTADC